MKDASDRNVSIVDLENNMDDESGDKKNVELRKKISFKGLMKRFTESKSKNQVKNSSTHSGAGSDTVPNAEQNESYAVQNSSTHSGAGSDTVPNAEQNESYAVHNDKDEPYCSVGSRENRNVSNHALPTSPTSVAGILGDTKEINCETQEKSSLVHVNIENLAVSNAFSGILDDDTKEIKCETQEKVGAIKTEKKPHSGRCSDVETQSVSSTYVSAPRSQLRQLADRMMCNNNGNLLHAHSTFESYNTFDEEGTIPEDRSFLTGVLNKSEPMMDVLNLLTCGPANDPMEEFMEDSRIASFSDSPTFTLSNSASGDSFWDSVKKPISRSSSK